MWSTKHLLGRNLFIVPLLFLTLIVGGCAQVPTVQMSPIAAPAGFEVPRADWFKLNGSNGHRSVMAVLRPQGSGPFPVVVVLHGADGLAGRYLSVADDLARAGFLVVAGCWQAGEAKTPGNTLCEEASPQTAWIADPAANSGKDLIAAARSLPDARADRIGLYGMSRGGHAALWAASTGAGVQAVVADAPAHRPAITPAPPSTLDVVDRLDAPLLILHGSSDNVIPVAQSQEYERAARALGKSISVVYFDGIGHIASVQPGSQAEARQRAIAFFREKL